MDDVANSVALMFRLRRMPLQCCLPEGYNSEMANAIDTVVFFPEGWDIGTQAVCHEPRVCSGGRTDLSGMDCSGQRRRCAQPQ